VTIPGIKFVVDSGMVKTKYATKVIIIIIIMISTFDIERTKLQTLQSAGLNPQTNVLNAADTSLIRLLLDTFLKAFKEHALPHLSQLGSAFSPCV